jgi:hypothetical protein
VAKWVEDVKGERFINVDSCELIQIANGPLGDEGEKWYVYVNQVEGKENYWRAEIFKADTEEECRKFVRSLLGTK